MSTDSGTHRVLAPDDGRVPPRFRVLAELGRGGMGVVHEVCDERGVVLAIKGLRDLRPREILRIKDEFRAVRDIQHPNLCRLGELFEDDGRWYYTMELVPGTDFLRWVRPDDAGRPARPNAVALLTPCSTARSTDVALDSDEQATRSVAALDDDTRTAEVIAGDGPRLVAPAETAREAPAFDEDRLRAALRGIVDALSALHRAGLVHRDIKPSNLRVEPDGRVVVLDFGVVAAVGRADAEVAGTPAYMAPEQARGEVSPAVDWYAVGILLYRALTGYLPFAATAHGLQLRGHQLPPSPSLLVRDLPEDLVALCLHLLAPEPVSRAGERAMRDVLGEPDSITPVPLAGEGHWWRSSPGVPFVGRDDELGHLRRVLGGRGVSAPARVVLVTGASGMGKTAVVHHFLRELLDQQPGTVVLSGRCDQRELIPYNALDGIVDDLARLLAATPGLADPRLVGGDELARLFPVLASVVPAGAGPLRPDADRERAASALADLLSSVASRHPVVLFVDDLHWADADSVALLGDLLAGDRSPPVLVIATARSSATTCPAARAIRVPIDELPLRGLDDSEVRRLVDAVTPGGAAVDSAAIARDAAGHPMFVAELARFAGERRAAAGGLDDALWERTRDLAEPPRHLLATVVTAGAPLEVAIAVEAAGLAPAAGARAVDDLRAARMVRLSRRDDRDVVEPYHDRLAEAVASRLAAPARADLHRHLAAALAAHDAAPEPLAYHLSAAGERAAAAIHAERAAARAAAAFAYDRAAEWYTMALAGEHGAAARDALLIARAEMLGRAGRPGEAAAGFLEAAAGAATDSIAAMDLRRRSFEQYLVGGYLDEGLAVAGELLTDLDLELPRSRTRVLAGLLWNRWRTDRTRLTWTPRTSDQLDPRERLRLDTCWSATAGFTLADAIRGAAYSARLPRMCLAAGEPFRIARAFTAEAFTAAVFHQRRRLERMEEAIARASTESNLEELRAYWTIARAARAFFFESDWAETARLTEEGREQWRATHGELGWEADLMDMLYSWARLSSGEYGALRRHVLGVVRSAQRTGNRIRELGFRCQFPHIHLVVDQADEAAADVDEAYASWHVPAGLDPADNLFYWTTKARTSIALYRGDDDAAALEDAWHRVEQSLIVQIPAVQQEMGIARGHWRLARARQRPDHARRLLAGAAADARRVRNSGAVTGSVNAALIEAGIAEVRGHRDAAIAKLTSALPQLERFGMFGPAAAVRWVLGRAVGGVAGGVMRDNGEQTLRTFGATRPERLVHVFIGGWET